MKAKRTIMDIELGLIGWLIVMPSAYWLVETVKGDHFSDANRGAIWDLLCKMRSSSSGALSLTLIRGKLSEKGLVSDENSIAWIADCRDAAPTSESDAKAMADMVRAAHRKKAYLTLATDIATVVRAGEEEDPTNAVGELYSKTMRETTRVSVLSMEELIQQDIKEMEASAGQGVPGLRTGFTKLDSMLGGGAHDGDLIIIAARPSMGKSALASWLAYQFSVNLNQPGYVATLEMSDMAYVQRMICARAKVSIQSRRACTMNASESERYVNYAKGLQKSKMYVDGSSSLSIAQLKARTRRMYEEHGIRYVAVDYLQLMKGDSAKHKNREQDVSSVSHGLKEIAMDLKLPMIAVAQLNRGNTMTADNRPKLHHLRESGSIEQDADTVILMHREDYYHNAEKEEEYQKTHTVELIVDKQRNGPTGTVDLRWVGEFGRFVELTDDNGNESQSDECDTSYGVGMFGVQ